MGSNRSACRIAVRLCASAVLLSVGSLSARADGPTTAPSAPDYTSLSLEDLMNVEVTSVTKTKQRAAEAPAAIYVITQEDIRRSNLFSIPELLRLAPGLDVAQVNASTWAISSRGFNDIFANKLLVLMDGRTVYTTLFSGVYWDTVDYPLPDLDRIEVIRGPGATLWGANAVNGVINITTKSARDTQGLMVNGVASNIEQIGDVRYGGKIDDETYYRVYTKYRNVDDFPIADGDTIADGWESARFGFRVDRFSSSQDVLTFQGDAYRNLEGDVSLLPSFTAPFNTPGYFIGEDTGANVLGRWVHQISDQSDFMLQLYVERLYREQLVYNYGLDTFDLEFQHRFQLGSRQEIIWGGGYRFLMDDVHAEEIANIDPHSRDDYISNLFVQDNIAVVPDQLHWYVGSKFELTSYSGFEVQPNTRLLWTPNEKNSVWAAISRAVRTPSRAEQDATIVEARSLTADGAPVQTNLVGTEGFQSEELIAYEIGYRAKPVKMVAVDVAGFFNKYQSLRSFEVQPTEESTTPPPHAIVPLLFDNKFTGQTYGVELATTWTPRDDWRVTASWSFLEEDLHATGSSTDSITQSDTLQNPQNQLQLHSYYDITKNLEFNAGMYYVETLPTFDIPSYLRVDLGLTYRPVEDLELTVGVANLLDNQHPEFGKSLFVRPTEVPRQIFGELTYRW